MKRLAALAGIALLAACTDASQPPTSGDAPAPSGGIAWVKDYDAGMAQAKADGKPVLLFFSADW